jgi:hypothetical protein
MADHHPELEPHLSSGPRPWVAGEEERGRSMVTGELRVTLTDAERAHLRIWPTEPDPDTGDVPGDTYEVVDVSGEGETLMIGRLAECQEHYPGVPVSAS